MCQLTGNIKRSRRRSINDKGETLLGRASILHQDFWLEALDAHHRYGTHLRAFHKAWITELETRSYYHQDASFFHWLDHGNGRNISLPECSQHGLRTTHVAYCNAEERKPYQLDFGATLADRVVRVRYATSGRVVHTDEQSKWIFVIDLAGGMYLGRKHKGRFHHSSFVSGAPIYAAGKIIIKHGIILAVEPHSGHFKPQIENLQTLCSILAHHGVDVGTIAFIKPKRWICGWPFPSQPALDLEDVVTASDTDCEVDKSDGEDLTLLLQEHELT